jgi:leucyl-tRNA synthetase
VFDSKQRPHLKGSNPEEPAVPLRSVWEKMSKSKKNGVEPADVCAEYGSDTTRIFTLFKAPPEKNLEWDASAIRGQHRWLKRIWRLVQQHVSQQQQQQQQQQDVKQLKSSTSNWIAALDVKGNNAEQQALLTVTCESIDAVTAAMHRSQFNVALARLMELSNALTNAVDNDELARSAVFAAAVSHLVTMLAPFAPHMSAELFSALAQRDVHQEAWPCTDGFAPTQQARVAVVSLNGKFVTSVDLAASAATTQSEIKLAVGQHTAVAKALRNAVGSSSSSSSDDDNIVSQCRFAKVIFVDRNPSKLIINFIKPQLR